MEDHELLDILQQQLTMPKDEEVDTQRILIDKVSLKLLFSLENEVERAKWFPSIKTNGSILSPTKNGFPIRKDIYFGYQPPFLQVYNSFGTPLEEIKTHPDFNDALSPLIRAYSIANGIKDKNGFWPYDDNFSLNRLAKKMNLNEKEYDAPFEIPENQGYFRSWQFPRLQNYLGRPIFFNSENGSQELLLFERPSSYVNSRLSLFPVELIGRTNSFYPEPCALMPQGRIPLFNRQKIGDYGNTPIVISEYLRVAEQLNNNVDFISTTWFKGRDHLKQTKWDCLDSQQLYYLWIYDGSIIGGKEDALRTAFALYSHLVDALGEKHVRMKIVECHFQYPLFMKQKPTIYDKYDFAKLCEDNGIQAPAFLKNYEATISSDQNSSKTKVEKHLISPWLRKNSLAMFYSPSGLGKTWLAMSIGLAVARGMNVCPKWTVESKGENVFYLAGEMSQEELAERMEKLRLAYPNTGETRFFYQAVRTDLGSKAGQTDLERCLSYFRNRNNAIRFLILDNLNTLVKNGEYKSGWDAFFDWLADLQNEFAPLAVLVVHHTNKSGEFMGTSSIKNRINVMFHADDRDPMEEQIIRLRCTRKEAEAEDKIRLLLKKIYHNDIRMFIAFEKTRFISKMDCIPFWLSFEPEKAKDGWQISDVSYREDIECLDAPIHGESLSLEPTEIPNSENDVEIMSLVQETAGIPWKKLDKEHRHALTFYLNKTKGISAQKIANRYGISLRSVQSSIAYKPSKADETDTN